MFQTCFVSFLCQEGEGFHTCSGFEKIHVLVFAVQLLPIVTHYGISSNTFSYLYILDLPSILSNTRIGFIDPHEEHFNDAENQRTGYDWRLSDVPKIMEQIPDQFLPYRGIFDCGNEIFARGHYSGTLFRFPLRANASKLSQTLYSAEKVEKLFESFIADAHLVLLFLRKLESIELYTREESEDLPTRIFRVKIDKDSLEFARVKREEFYDRVKQCRHLTEPVTVTYPLTIETETNGEMQRHSFLVTSYCYGGQVSAQFKELLADETLSLLPSVGVAMALPSIPQTPDISGHVFCALPLPVQKKSMTGLPVHVNGFFALSQNRRHIKTPNADQEDRGKLTDKSLLWNCCLLEEAVPNAYATLICEAIESNVQPESIYK